MVERRTTPDGLQVQVCYARPDATIMINLRVASSATIEQAILQSGILERVPEIDLTRNKIGIFGKIKPIETPLQDHDRVEIYRPLAIDPKEARRLRAQRQAGG